MLPQAVKQGAKLRASSQLIMLCCVVLWYDMLDHTMPCCATIPVVCLMQDRQTVLLPQAVKQDAKSRASSQIVKLNILKSFEFNSQILMSGALVTSSDLPATTGLLFVKGAHAAIKGLLQPASLPADYEQASVTST